MVINEALQVYRVTITILHCQQKLKGHVTIVS